MPAAPQLSLCIAETSTDVRADSNTLADEFFANVTQFFAKFPLQFEVLIAGHDAKLQETVETYAKKDPRFRWVETSTKSRAKKIERLFNTATGDNVVVSSLSLEVPLGEVFRWLQEFYTEKDVQVIFGNRFAQKKGLPRVMHSEPWIERFYRGVIRERAQWPFVDPFCPVFALRRSAYDVLKPHVKFSGWYLTPEIQRATLKAGLKYLETPLHSAPTDADAGPVGDRLEPLRLLAFVLFRI